jgi:hypothetical protein
MHCILEMDQKVGEAFRVDRKGPSLKNKQKTNKNASTILAT